MSLSTEREASARLAGELAAARRIQMGLLPSPASVARTDKRIEIFAHLRPAHEVGGDLYDFFPIPEDKFVILAGDVSGKGLPAAIFMAIAKALAKSCALRCSGDPAELMTRLDREISGNNSEQMFVTVIAVVVDLKTGAVAYCNGGHEPPILARRSGQAQVLDQGGGPPLCVIDDYSYERADVRLQPRDILLIASDGITEAANNSGSLYGRDRLKALLESAARQGRAPSALGNDLLADVKEFETNADPVDDQTLLLVSWQP